MAGVHAARHSGSAGDRRASTSRRFHRQRISCAMAKGLAPSSFATACGSSARVAPPAAARKRAPPGGAPGARRPRSPHP
eukprot:7351595-Prymnesium_polylepis.1